MDYIKDHDLKELIHTSGTLSIQTAISITKQICMGLKAAHQKNIIHLDLKPRNIMLDSDGRVYIMDFGVARSLGAHEVVQEKKLIGTPAYISPEQAKGDEVDKRSDIYSLGVILFEMLTGKRPFEADTLDSYVDMHIHKKPPRPSEIRQQIPPFLDDIILKCLKKDKDNRCQKVTEILEDLDAHEEESQFFRPQLRTKKTRGLLYVIPVILLIAIGLYLLLGKKTNTSFLNRGRKNTARRDVF
jgi:serine/threonine-protein kinase